MTKEQVATELVGEDRKEGGAEFVSATVKVEIRQHRTPTVRAAGLSERRRCRSRSARGGAGGHALDPAARQIRDGADRADDRAAFRF